MRIRRLTAILVSNQALRCCALRCTTCQSKRRGPKTGPTGAQDCSHLLDFTDSCLPGSAVSVLMVTTASAGGAAGGAAEVCTCKAVSTCFKHDLFTLFPLLTLCAQMRPLFYVSVKVTLRAIKFACHLTLRISICLCNQGLAFRRSEAAGFCSQGTDLRCGAR
jgi:hypothetical protein